jgi:predicted NAD-dependent protein-ADP-ribosyltransferase YbiA (DUF1768 family)
MVKSQLDNTIEYSEAMKLDNIDKDFEATIYDIWLFDMDIVIAIGQPKYTFVERNILYYPIYLVKNKKVNIQIGVYEIKNSDLQVLIDEDGDINIELLNEPLLYSFVDKELIMESEAEAESVSEAESIKLPLAEQGSLDAEKERMEFDKKDKSVTWIQKYMKNANYRIVDNEGSGDCLFAVIRDGLKTIEKNISVNEMRKILADNITEELLETYRTLYENAKLENTISKNALKELTARNKTLKEKMKITTNRTELANIIKQAEDVQNKHKEIKYSNSNTEYMIREFNFMKDVKTLTQLKAKLQSCDFWGNTWAISTLEVSLNIKLIILSEQNYNENDIDHVLQCGQLNDDIEEFRPSHYIIANHQRNHYQLITYKDYGALTYKELPYDIKMLIVDKCIERLAGPYYIIPDFRELKKNEIILIAGKKKDKIQEEELHSDLYNNLTVFQYYIYSMNNFAPGAGYGEIMGPEGLSEYSDLIKFPLWRKMLSNAWPTLFKLDGHKWLSVDHYYEGSKFKRKNKEYYLQFSLDSNSELSKNPAMAQGAADKLIKTEHKITIDDDFFSGRDKKEMEDALFAKFSQNEDLKKVLLATKKAKLTHFVKKSPPVISNELMIVRQRLN